LFKFLDNNISSCAFVFNRYSELVYDLLKSREVQEKTEEFDDLMKMTSKYTGLNITDFIGLAILYGTLEAELAMGLSLPEWTQDIFPNGKLTDAMVSTYSIIISYDHLTNLNAGMFKQKIYFIILFIISYQIIKK